jgi:hypothetical protein
MGLSYRAIDNEVFTFTMNGDMNKLLANDDWVLKRLISAWHDDGGWQELDSTIFGVGGEFVYWNLLALRAGYIYDKAGKIIGPSFGVGVKYTFAERFHTSFDFAMQRGGEMTNFNKTFSLGLEF